MRGTEPRWTSGERARRDDRQRNDDEWRVIRRFANAWGYPIDRLEHLDRSIGRGYAPVIRRAWLSLRALLVSE
jgi:hypothetical protein